MNISLVVAVVIFAPAFAALGYAVYAMVKFMRSRRDASLTNELVLGALGVFAVFVPKLMKPESKKYFNRFLLAAGFFCLYSAALMFIAHVLGE